MIDFYELLKRAVEDLGLEPDQILSSYSGRGMYGKTCVGFTCKNLSQLFELINCMYLELVEKGEDSLHYDLEELGIILQSVKSDNLGLDMVYYWPRVQAVSNEDPA